ncbi:MFS transporter, partial [Ilumatobacter sp.]|uniref:MFS transporter n=1 Tax=Ilumatobacter sp. TaxID=1967498 RepID=UPI003AF7E2F0
MSTSSSPSSTSNANAGVLLALGLAMFVYVIDTTIMGVSITDLVVDLDTDVSLVQMAITVYTLTMAAFMITGGKLGTIWGPRKAFRIGLAIYLVGTIVTAASPNIATLLIGWSVLEGLGSALMVPAINTLVRSNFPPSGRAAAYGVLGGVAAAGAAFGPIIGGWITTNYTWRLAFVIEAVIVVGVLLASVKIKEGPLPDVRPKLDVLGVILSALGLALLVFGILQTSSLGMTSPVVWGLILVGLLILGVFSARAIKQEREGEETLVRLSIMKNRVMSAGVPVTIAQTFAQNGVLFLVPLYAQMVLGLDAFETGLTILPLSIAVMLFSVGTSKLGHKVPPRAIIQVGLIALLVGGVVFARAIPNSTSGSDFAVALFIIGAGVGLVAAQLPNMMLGGVAEDETSEASGIQGTAQNLGMSLGTAVAGSVVILAL